MKFKFLKVFVDDLIQKKPLMFILGVVGCALIFWIDYSTVERYSFFLFYLMPIILAAWFVGSRSSYLMAFFCSFTWYMARLNLEPPPDPQVLLWNTAIRFSSFTFIAWIMNRLRDKQKKMADLQKQFENLLDLEKKISRQDSLTGALNSRAFYERLAEERSRSVRYAHPMSMLYIDLDGFKTVNDLHGHEFGDDLLKKVVAIVKGCIRDVDMLARLGGDEFAVLLPETRIEGAQACAQKIMDALKRDISKNTTISVGVAYFNSIPKTNEEAVQAADHAMYRAKKTGKNKLVSVTI